jgi:L-ribulokinase
MSKYTIGLDFGTDSVRALVVDAISGKEISSGISYYSRWSEVKYTDPIHNQFRQHPLDYLEGMEHAVRFALDSCGEAIKDSITGIGIDTTGSTPCAVDKKGTALALREDFKDDPDEMFILETCQGTVL